MATCAGSLEKVLRCGEPQGNGWSHAVSWLSTNVTAMSAQYPSTPGALPCRQAERECARGQRVPTNQGRHLLH